MQHEIFLRALPQSDNKTSEEKTEALERLTDETELQNGVGDIQAVNNVVESVTESSQKISEETTENIVQAVSNIMQAEISVSEGNRQTANEAKNK